MTRTLVRCLIYVRISLDDKHDEHGVANQMAKLEQRAGERGWTVVYRLSDNDIGVTRKDPTRPGKYRPGYEEAMRLVDARMVDAVLCFKWDRFIREPLDLEYLIPRFDKAGVRFAEVDGSIDLGTDSGRLHARIMIAVAKAEQERKAERQKLAFEQAAINGKRFTGCPRPFGYQDDHVTVHPVEGPAVAEACAALLGGGTISGIRREWTTLGLKPPQQAQRGTTTWNRTSIRMILLNPRIAGLSAYHGEIVGQGNWEPLVPEETWRAVRGILDDPTRKPPRGVKTLLGGLARCPCGNVVTGMPSHTGHHIYRCTPATRNRAYHGGHVARQAEPVETFIEKLVVVRLSRSDAAAWSRSRTTGWTWRRCGRKRQQSARTWRKWPATGRWGRSPARRCSRPPRRAPPGWRRSAPSWNPRRGRTCWPRWSRPRTPPPCGPAWISAASGR